MAKKLIKKRRKKINNLKLIVPEPPYKIKLIKTHNNPGFFLLIVLMLLFIFLILLFSIKVEEKPSEKGLPTIGIGKEGSLATNWDECNFQDSLINPESIIPRPQNINLLSCDIINIDSSWKIFADTNTEDNFSAFYLNNKTLEKTSGLINLEIKDINNLESNKRIVIGNPNTNPAIRQIAESNNIIFDSEITKGFNQGYILLIKPNEILILANSTTGAFYGVITLLWQLKPNNNLLSLPNVKINDWPDLEMRVYYGRGLWKKSDIEWIDQLAMWKYNLWMGSLYRLIPTSSQSIIDYNKHREMLVKQRHIQTCTDMRPYFTVFENPNLYEGVFVENVSMKFNDLDIAELSYPEPVLINNSDFETDIDQNNFPDSWHQTYSYPQKNWSIDCTTASSGSCSIKLNVSISLSTYESSPVLFSGKDPANIYFPIKPNKVYQFSLWAKKNAPDLSKPYSYIMFVVTNSTKTPMGYYSINFDGMNGYALPNNENWKEYRIFIPTYTLDNETYLYMYAKAQGSGPLELWFDNMSLMEVDNKLVNVIDTEDSKIRIFNQDKAVMYTEGVDYAITTTGIINITDPLRGSKKIINRIPSGAIPTNSKISIEYDYVTKIRSTISLSDPEALNVYNKSILYPTLSIFKTECAFIGTDEIFGFNRDSRAKKRGYENYETFAYFVNNVTSLIHSYDKNIKVFIWDDMFNPLHSGNNPNILVPNGGPQGKIWPAMDIMNRKNLIFIPWIYDTGDPANKLKISTQLYTRYGYESIGGGWYRVNNTRWWSYIAYRDNSLGLIFHDFYSNGIGAMELANYSWNAEKDYTEQCDPEHAEICDGIDNDCDDLYYQLGSSIQKNWGSNIDESFNLTKDPFNCGSCGNICYYPNSYRSCVNGVCQFDGCFKNYYDFDNNINNGCECNKKDGCFCEITNNGDEICDGIDNNCNDEVDEGLDCSIDNPTPPEDSSSSGGGGGGGGGSYTTTPSNYTNFSSYSFCNENWICGDFGECINGKQRRECYDSNECNTEKNLPEIVRECLVVKDNASERPFRMAMNENILIKSKGIIIPLLSGIIIILIIIISFIFIRESKRKKEIFEQRKKQRALIFVKAKYLVEEFKKRGYNEEYIKDKFREKGWLESDIEKIIGGVK